MLRHRAALHRELGQSEKAVWDFEQVQGLDPGDPSAKEKIRQALEAAQAQGP